MTTGSACASSMHSDGGLVEHVIDETRADLDSPVRRAFHRVACWR
jgi:hypothetical protein